MQRRKIDDNRLIALLNEHKLQKDIAKEFGVSPAAITKRIKRLIPPPPSLEVLTEKEKRFAIERAGGLSATQAALRAFECGSLSSAKSIGHQLMGKPIVKHAIDELLEMQGTGRAFRVSKLGEHMRHHDPVISIKAIDMACKLAGDEEEAKRRLPEKQTFTEIDLSPYGNVRKN